MSCFSATSMSIDSPAMLICRKSGVVERVASINGSVGSGIIRCLENKKMRRRRRRRRKKDIKAGKKVEGTGKAESLDLGLPCAENLGGKFQDDPLRSDVGNCPAVSSLHR